MATNNGTPANNYRVILLPVSLLIGSGQTPICLVRLILVFKLFTRKKDPSRFIIVKAMLCYVKIGWLLSAREESKR